MIILTGSPSLPEIDVSQVVNMAREGQLAQIQIKGDNLDVTTNNGEVFRSRKETSVSLLALLAKRLLVEETLEGADLQPLLTGAGQEMPAAA